jgi:glutamate synthase (NADPH) small chain
MFNMNPKKTPVKEQDGKERIKNFNEVTFGYTKEEAILEAKRCIQCKIPKCVEGCPVNVYIPQFIKKVAEEDFEAAYKILKEQNSLPAVCGRVCPQERQCESKCVRGLKGESVGIGRLERFVADYYMANYEEPEIEIEKNGIKVAVIGAGPAGIACAGDLARMGYDVTIFEALHTPGGVLMYGIPEFRLPKSIVAKEIGNLKKIGVKIEKNVIIGRSITIDELIEDGFKGVFIGSGAGLPKFMKMKGENLNGVYSANEFLTRVNLMKAYKEGADTPVRLGNKVAVIGGGNVAMDAARTALRLGAEKVYIVYRRGEEELPARLEEIHHAKEEGVEFRLLTGPLEIAGENGWTTGLKCIQMELGEPDRTGRRTPVETAGSEFIIETDTVIMAIGQTPNPLITSTTSGLKTEKNGGIIVNEETMETTKERVYAGGDIVTGAATVILAMGAGKKAAKAINEKLNR